MFAKWENMENEDFLQGYENKKVYVLKALGLIILTVNRS
jgi:hypothetical protein